METKNNLLCAVSGSIRWIVLATRDTRQTCEMLPSCWASLLGKQIKLSFEIGAISMANVNLQLYVLLWISCEMRRFDSVHFIGSMQVRKSSILRA